MPDIPPERPATVFVVDDNASVRDSVAYLLHSVGLAAETYAGPAALLVRSVPDGPGCVVVDVRMPGMSGLDLLEVLRLRGWQTPVVFITAHATVPTAVRAMRAGAVDFMEKPVDDERLLDRIRRAIALDRARLAAVDERRGRTVRYDLLTEREREVLALVLEGLANKEIAARLDIRPKTVESHRASIMTKMKAGSLAELVTHAIRNGFTGKPSD